jgi:8-oxo-dGTP pyrophosphatase MutT (NUDIX family)
MNLNWAPLLAQASRRNEPRLPLRIGALAVGSVAIANLPALAVHAEHVRIEEQGVRLHASDPSAALAHINAALRQAGLIRAWRNETYAVLPEGAQAGDTPLALIERAASRFWGTLTFGAHCNGYVADAQGRPAQLWIARRAHTKATDPGKLDNLVGGGVPHGQTPFEALVREGFEEAGLDPATMKRAQTASVLHLRCDIAEGFMNEHLHSFDLQLPAGLPPHNQDGEVQAWHCRPIAKALEHAARGEMTMDAGLVTLDFAVRHGLLHATPAVQERLDSLRLASPEQTADR